jgi:type IV secretion system protein VirB5
MTIKAESKRWSPSAPLDTPYRRAKAEWDSRMGALMQNSLFWRRAAIACFAMMSLSLIGLIYLGRLPKLEPYIVEVKANGQSEAKGLLAKAWSSYTPSGAAISYHLREFIGNVREISSDVELVKRRLLKAYHFIQPEAANMLNTLFREDSPLKRAAKERVTVELTAMVQIAEDVWQCDWTEMQWNPQGMLLGKTNWRGIFRLKMQKPEKAEELEQNPLGMYISEFHWSKINP